MTPLRLILAAAAIVCLVYCLWAMQRIGPSGLLDPSWPRPVPYPDRFLSQYHSWLDANHPSPPGTYKSHGELYRVRRTLRTIFATLTVLLAFAVIPSLRSRRLQPDAPPNGGPAEPSAGSGVTDRPPSVS
jgi:hypothetical protein